MRPHPDVFCKAGNGSPNKPLICVDETTLMASPHHTKVYDVEESRDHKPTDRQVTIHWFSRRTADLRIEFIDTDCTEKVECDGRGHCWTKTKVKLKKGETKQCKYGMTLGDTKYDPEDDIIINPCCF